MSGPSRSLRSALAVVLVAAVAYGIARTRRDFWDFEVYRTAGVRALSAEPLYRPDDGHYQFKYWPAFALAMTPFGLIDPEVGKVVWYALSIGFLIFFFRLSIGALPERRSTERFLSVWTFLLTGKFIVKELVNGQTNALLGVLIVLALLAARQRHPVAAGALVGAAVFVKPYALLFVPWLASTAGLIATGSTLGVIVAGLLLPAVVYGWQGNLALLGGWYQTVADTTATNLLFPENISLAAMWAKWLGPGSTASALAALTAAACLAAALAVWRKRRSVGCPDYLEMSFLLVLVPLISPQGWDYVLLVAIPAVVCLVDRFREDSTRWKLITIAGFILTSFTIYDLLGRTLYMSLMSVSIVTVGALVLAACLFHLRIRSLA